MSSTSNGFDVSSIATRIRSAFGWRHRPNKKTDSAELTEDEVISLNEIWKFNWDEIPDEVWKCHSDVLSWLSSLAFCYYLPGALTYVLHQNGFDGLVASRIGIFLDSTPEFDGWDDFFIDRWSELTLDELEAIEMWLRWFCDRTSIFDEISLIRMLLTIGILKANKICLDDH